MLFAAAPAVAEDFEDGADWTPVMIVLGIETTCDKIATAVAAEDRSVRANLVCLAPIPASASSYSLAGGWEGCNQAGDRLVEGYMWTALAATQGHRDTKTGVGRLRKHMTAEEIEEAGKLVRTSRQILHEIRREPTRRRVGRAPSTRAGEPAVSRRRQGRGNL